MRKIFLSIIAGAVSSALLCFSASAQNDINVYALEGMPAAVYYDAAKPLEAGDACETAIVVIHGWGGGASANGSVRIIGNAVKDAYVLAPRFPRRQVMEKQNVPYDGRAVWNDSWSADLTRPGMPDDDWRGGGDANGLELSSYDVIDELFARLGDKTKFPNLKKVVLCGFSAGGQFVGRYVAVGKGKVRKGVKVEYAYMSPSTQFFFNPDVSWHYGLAGRPRYSAGLSERKIMRNLCSRKAFCGCGSADITMGALDRTPSAMLQGETRYGRFLHFKDYVKRYPRWEAQLTFHTFEGLAHDSKGAYADPAFAGFVTGNVAAQD